MKLLRDETSHPHSRPLFPGGANRARRVRKVFLPGTGWTWYASAGSQQENDFLFFGFVVGLGREFGYFLLSELESVRTQLGLAVERDLAFREGRLTDVILAPEL